MLDSLNGQKILTVLFVVVIMLFSLANISYGAEEFEYATFAGGCFWCMEAPFEKLDGVIEAKSGYTGGEKVEPSYEEVAAGSTDHLESVQVKYNPQQVSYAQLVEVFWQQIDPTDDKGQFVDRGYQYTTAIFYHDQQQKEIAKKSKELLARANVFNDPIVTPVRAAKDFYFAEDYHQDYYQKSTLSYKFYRFRSGRDQYLDKIWNQENLKVVDQISELSL